MKRSDSRFHPDYDHIRYLTQYDAVFIICSGLLNPARLPGEYGVLVSVTLIREVRCHDYASTSVD
jgi:hypothetical protein